MNPGFHESALRGLGAGRQQKAWSCESILTAQKDFRWNDGLPRYATMWRRRFGSIAAAVELAGARGQ